MKDGEFIVVNNKSKSDSRIEIAYASLFFGLLAAIFVFYIITGITGPKGIGIERRAKIFNEWRVEVEGSAPVNVTLPFEQKLDKGVTVSYFATLPNDVTDKDYLSFETATQYEVYINGVFRKDFIPKRDAYIPGGIAEANYAFVPLSSKDSGGEIEIRRNDPKGYNGTQYEVLLGESHAIVTYYFYDRSAIFFAALFLAIVTLILIIVCFVLRFVYHMEILLTWATVGVFMVSCWIVSNSPIFPFIFERSYIDGTLSFLFCLLIPPPFCSYFNALQRGRYKKQFYIFGAVAFANFIVFTTLHFTGVLSFTDGLVYLDLVLAGLIVATFVIIVLDYYKGYLHEYRYTVMGICLFIIFAVLDIALRLFALSHIDGVPIFFGLVAMLIFAVIQQVSDLRQADAERRAAIEESKAKTNFLASMSHEIRTPINTILGMNEMILRENEDVTINQYAKNAQTAGKMLLALVNDVLDFSKIESGKMELVSAEYLLADILNAVNAIAYESSKGKGIEYSYFIDESVPAGMVGDEFRIRQILVNLVSNAVKYTDSGNVNLRIFGKYSDEDNYELKMSVSDTGKGIVKEELDTLFDAFYRADYIKNKAIEGTGLGLAIVKQLIDNMDGTVKVDSVYGEGSVFTVTIPQKVYDKSRVVIDPEEARLTDNAGFYKCLFTAPEATVLTVDDNGANLRIAYEFLKETKIKQVLMKSPKEAISRCFTNKYDLILLDHMMPEMDGMAVLDMIKNDSRSLNKDTNVLVLTANAIAGSKQMYLEAGFADYISKPIDSRLLEKKVAQYLPPEKVMYNK